MVRHLASLFVAAVASLMPKTHSATLPYFGNYELNDDRTACSLYISSAAAVVNFTRGKTLEECAHDCDSASNPPCESFVFGLLPSAVPPTTMCQIKKSLCKSYAGLEDNFLAYRRYRSSSSWTGNENEQSHTPAVTKTESPVTVATRWIKPVSNPKAACTAPVKGNSTTSETGYDVKESIVWPIRWVWPDPGPTDCKIPTGLDAGLCVRTYSIGTARSRKTGLKRSTQDIRCLPSFVILGVQKAGTRELRNWLHIHPNLTSTTAELGYLDSSGCTNPSRRRARVSERKSSKGGLCNHSASKLQVANRAHFWRGYLDHFPPMKVDAVRTQYTFEKTPKYLEMSKGTISRLRRLAPSMKFLIMLREPASRAYSWFNMVCFADQLNHTRDNENSSKRTDLTITKVKQEKQPRSIGGASGFAEIQSGLYAGEIWAIRHNTEKMLKGEKWSAPSCTAATFERYIMQAFAADGNVTDVDAAASKRTGVHEPILRGHYAVKLKRWFAEFPKEHFHVSTMDALIRNAAPTMSDIEDFLGLPHFPYVQHFGMSSTGTTVMQGPDAPGSKVERGYKKSIEPMSRRAMNALRQHFGPHDEHLKHLLDLDELPW
jgi:hypothetical protein